MMKDGKLSVRVFFTALFTEVRLVSLIDAISKHIKTMSDDETQSIVITLAAEGHIVTPEQVRKAVTQLAEIMLMAESEFGIRISPELDHFYGQDLPASHIQ